MSPAPCGTDGAAFARAWASRHDIDTTAEITERKFPPRTHIVIARSPMDLPARKRYARLISQRVDARVGGRVDGTTISWSDVDIAFRVDSDAITCIEGDGGYTLRRGMTLGEIAQHIADKVDTTRRRRAEIRRLDAAARAVLGGERGAAIRRFYRANTHEGGVGDSVLAQYQHEIRIAVSSRDYTGFSEKK